MTDTAPQTILVTGGSGYIAGYVIAALIARGFRSAPPSAPSPAKPRCAPR